MSAEKNKRRRRRHLFFASSLTKVSPAYAGSRARQRGKPEYSKPKQATPKAAFVFRKPLTNESPAYAGNRARQRGIREYKMSAEKNKSLIIIERIFYICLLLHPIKARK